MTIFLKHCTRLVPNELSLFGYFFTASQRNYFDVWLPELAPSAPLVSWFFSEPLTHKHWTEYARRYRREMQTPAARRLIELLAALSAKTNFSVGCYCKDEGQCHRSLLKNLLLEHDAKII